jgi:dGTPase
MAVEARERAPYASHPGQSRGRLHAEPADPARNDFRRDCDRIIHSTAFRRLKHKTQVFIFHEGDHFRTRLTHTLEVVQVARSLARALGLDEDLAEALALAHDLGHPPFGHAGERSLDVCLADYGGFDHNAQTLRIVTLLERRYPEFDGLNLTWDTLDGLVKHNGPLTDASGTPLERYRNQGIANSILLLSSAHGLSLSEQASAEAQIAALADDIAYDAHDIDDGLRAGLFALEDIADVSLPGRFLQEIRARHPHLDSARVVHELVRKLISHMIWDVTTETERRVEQFDVGSVENIRQVAEPIVGFSKQTEQADREIKSFLKARMYRHDRVTRIMHDAQQVLADLFAHYMAQPDDLPSGWLRSVETSDDRNRARRVADFIAGMTDRYALAEHTRYFDSTPELR